MNLIPKLILNAIDRNANTQKLLNICTTITSTFFILNLRNNMHEFLERYICNLALLRVFLVLK